MDGEGKRKLATVANVLPDRNSLHRYMATPGSCSECHGRGWFPAADGLERYCDCAAGQERRKTDP